MGKQNGNDQIFLRMFFFLLFRLKTLLLSLYTKPLLLLPNAQSLPMFLIKPFSNKDTRLNSFNE